MPPYDLLYRFAVLDVRLSSMEARLDALEPAHHSLTSNLHPEGLLS